MDQNFEKFSTIKTKLKIIENKGERRILKEVVLTSLDKKEINNVKELIIDYTNKLIDSGIPLPKIRDCYIKEGRLFFVCDYKGENLLQKYQNKDVISFFNQNKTYFLEIIKIILKAKKNNLFLDPHIKNFVINGGRLYYVDFSPPYCKEYNELVLNSLSGPHILLAKKNLEAFKPDNLGYHLFADLLKEDKSFELIAEKIYCLLFKNKVITNSFESFLIKAKEIKMIETERLKKRIFLI